MSWEESDLLVQEMIKGSTGELWGKKLEDSDHFPILKQALNLVENYGTLLDVGCGAGDVSRVWNGKYTGVDLSWIVERVSKKCNPLQEYLTIDLDSSTVFSLPESRVVLMNAFLDVREDSHDFFDSLLKMKYENFIVHRQRLSQNNSKIEYRKGYGTIVPSSVMSWERICQSVMQSNSNSKISLIHWQGDNYTFIVSR